MEEAALMVSGVVEVAGVELGGDRCGTTGALFCSRESSPNPPPASCGALLAACVRFLVSKSDSATTATAAFACIILARGTHVSTSPSSNAITKVLSCLREIFKCQCPSIVPIENHRRADVSEFLLVDALKYAVEKLRRVFKLCQHSIANRQHLHTHTHTH